MSIASALFAVTLVVAGALAWIKDYWSLSWRIQYTLVILAVLISVYLLREPVM